MITEFLTTFPPHQTARVNVMRKAQLAVWCGGFTPNQTTFTDVLISLFATIIVAMLLPLISDFVLDALLPLDPRMLPSIQA